MAWYGATQQQAEELRAVVESALAAAEELPLKRASTKRLARRLVLLLASMLRGRICEREVESLLCVQDSAYICRLELWRLLAALNNAEFEHLSGVSQPQASEALDKSFESWYVERTTECVGDDMAKLRQDPSFTGKGPAHWL